MHNCLARLLTKSRGESTLVVLVQVVLDERLTTELVDTLGDLVTSSKAETREKRSVLLEERLRGSILEEKRSALISLLIAVNLYEIYLEDNFGEVASGLGLVAHETLSNGVDGVENEELEDTRAGGAKETSGTGLGLAFGGNGGRHDNEEEGKKSGLLERRRDRERYTLTQKKRFLWKRVTSNGGAWVDDHCETNRIKNLIFCLMFPRLNPGTFTSSRHLALNGIKSAIPLSTSY